MKKTLLFFILSIPASLLFAQRLSTIEILPFAVSGDGVSAAEAEEVTRLVIAEFSSWGTLTVLSGDLAAGGEYTVRGQVSRQNGRSVVTAVTVEAASGKILNNSREEAAALTSISILSLCTQIAGNIPFPNYLLGKWQSTINMVDGPVICIMEFREDRTIRVERYDTWEHSGTNSLKYQGIGRGSYTYAGYRRRDVTLSGRTIQADATIGINITLEDALPKYTSVSRSGLRVLFDESKSAFTLVYGGLPCGDNFTGTSVYPSAGVFYTEFVKIR